MTPEQMTRMEREMESRTHDFKALEAYFGDDCLHLVIASGYLSRLVANPEILGDLRRRHPEVLDEFQAIIAATSRQACCRRQSSRCRAKAIYQSDATWGLSTSTVSAMKSLAERASRLSGRGSQAGSPSDCPLR